MSIINAAQYLIIFQLTQVCIKQMRMKCRWTHALITTSLLVTLLLSTGCSCYKWGFPKKQELPFKKLYIAPIKACTMIPQAQVPLSHHLVHTFQHCGIQIVSCDDQADATLEITLSDYRRDVVSTKGEDTQLARSFQVKLTACATLINNETCEACFKDKEIYANIHVLGNEGVHIQKLEYQDMPVLTQKLAQKIRNYVISPW